MTIRFKSEILNSRAASVRAFRKLDGHAKVMISCAGGCGHNHIVRAGKLKDGHLFICDRGAHRDQDLRNLPLVLEDGRVREIIKQQAGGFAGVVYRHKGFKATAAAIVQSWFRAVAFPVQVRLGVRTARP